MQYSKPYINDNKEFYAYMPIYDSLYNYSMNAIKRYIRVVDENNGNFTTVIYENTEQGSKKSAIVETIEFPIFIQYVSYGYTPYIEIILSHNQNNNIHLGDYENMLITCAMMRSYESRLKSLIELCKRKKNSIFTGFINDNNNTGQLLVETQGVLLLWEQLMNYGNISPANIVQDPPQNINQDLFAEKFDLLKKRFCTSDHVNLPNKIEPEDRKRLFKSLGVSL